MSETRYFRCLKDPSHLIAMDLGNAEYKKLVKKFAKGHAVCPHCKPENSPMSPCDPPETTSPFGGGYTLLACRHGHTTSVSAFANGQLHVKWGEDEGQFINIPGSPDEISELAGDKTISCNHTLERKRGWGKCGCKVKVIAGQAESPQATFIKTKTRVGDVWDKNKIARPSEGRVDAYGNYEPSELEKRHNERVRDIKGGHIKQFNEKSGKWERTKRRRVAKKLGDSTPTARRDSNKLSKRQARDDRKYDK